MKYNIEIMDPELVSNEIKEFLTVDFISFLFSFQCYRLKYWNRYKAFQYLLFTGFSLYAILKG